MENHPSNEDYIWYFRAEVDPFEKKSHPKRAPYDIGDNAIIENAFLEYS